MFLVCPVLGESDFPAVLRCVLEVLDMWDDLGMALGLPMAEIKVIKKDESTSKDRMKAVLSAWLCGRGLDPTWQVLCNALRDELVGRADIAEKIPLSKRV